MNILQISGDLGAACYRTDWLDCSSSSSVTSLGTVSISANIEMSSLSVFIRIFSFRLFFIIISFSSVFGFFKSGYKVNHSALNMEQTGAANTLIIVNIY